MLAMKGFMAKKSVVLNDDEPRPVLIPKDFVNLMICVMWKIQNPDAMNYGCQRKNRRVQNPEFRWNEKAADAVRKTMRHVENLNIRSKDLNVE